MRNRLTALLHLPEDPAWTGRLLLLILLLGALPRIFLLVRVSNQDFLHNDGGEYMDISRQLSLGNGFSLSYYRWHEVEPDGLPEGSTHPDLARTPLFPLLGSVLFFLPCDVMVSARILSLALSLLAIYCVFLLGRELTGRSCGLWSALLFAVYPYALYYSTSWSTENLFLICLVMAFLFLLKAMRGKFSALFWSGFFTALAALTRPTAILLPAVFAAALWFRFMMAGGLKWHVRKLKWVRPLPPGLLKHFGIFLLVFLMMMLPWMYRNHRVAGSWNPTTYYNGYIFWLSFSEILHETYRTLDRPEYTEVTTKCWEQEHARRLRILKEEGKCDFLSAAEQWKQWGWEQIRHSPDRAFHLLMMRFRHYWRMCPNLIILKTWQIYLLRTYFSMLFVSALAGVWLLKRRVELVIPLLPILFGMVISIPFLFVLRFRFPFFAPYICILAGLSWSILLRKRTRKAMRRQD